MQEFKRIPANKNSLSKRKPVYGVGVNDASYIVCPTVNKKKLFCQVYAKWREMLKRCYCDTWKEKYPTFKDCTVCDEWLIFSVFAAWTHRQKWEGLELDKNLIIPGNKHYGPETCMFVTKEINNLLLDSKSRRGEFPIGVYFDISTSKYKASCKAYGKRKNIGYFNKASEASQAYKKFKSNHVREIAEQQEPVLKYALFRHANLIEGIN